MLIKFVTKNLKNYNFILSFMPYITILKDGGILNIRMRKPEKAEYVHKYFTKLSALTIDEC